MSVMIIGALVLALFQLWLLPASLGFRNFKYVISRRDDAPPQTRVQQCKVRAGVNLQESLPASVALCLLPTIQQLDLTRAALAWLVLRVIYIPCYLFGIIYLRSIVWVGSLACLAYMAYELV